MKILWVSQLAGWLEGEGSFLGGFDTSGHSRTLQVRGGCTDRDVIETIQTRWGGHIWAEPRLGAKTMHRWHILGSQAAGLMMTLYTFMGERRRAQIRSALSDWRAATNPSKRKRDMRGRFLHENTLV